MKYNIYITISAIIIYVLSFFAYHYLYHKKLGYVRTGVLFEEYQEAIEANFILDREMQVVQANLDTLEKRYIRLKNQSEKDSETNYLANMAEEQFQNYSSSAIQQIEDRKNEMSSNVVQTVNEAIHEYGKKHGYKLILGTTSNGNILYADESDDLTELILEEMNATYKKNNGEH